MTALNTIPAIMKSFDVAERPAGTGMNWCIGCKTCGQLWEMRVGAEVEKPGPVLRLLEHARACAKTVKANARNRDALNRFFGG